jgi:nicotinate-nucleotide pyrophosphorylase (carboxylating)
VTSLPDFLVEPVVRAALHEDLGRAGDLTSAAVLPAELQLEAALVARADGVVSGLGAARLAFELLDRTVAVQTLAGEGSAVAAGTELALVRGPARSVLAAERVALNFLGRLSGIATATADLVAVAAPHGAGITCTRKTTPGLRALEKRAVRAGGGRNHRFGLDDAILIKDNHVAAAGGVVPALRRARAAAGHLVKVQLEVDDLEQLRAALPEGPDAVLLDNMAPAELRTAVRLVAGRAVTEASGGVTRAGLAEIAATGVDLISVGALTHSAAALDVALDVRDL